VLNSGIWYENNISTHGERRTHREEKVNTLFSAISSFSLLFFLTLHVLIDVKTDLQPPHNPSWNLPRSMLYHKEVKERFWIDSRYSAQSYSIVSKQVFIYTLSLLLRFVHQSITNTAAVFNITGLLVLRYDIERERGRQKMFTCISECKRKRIN
jgi:hypothetical protein